MYAKFESLDEEKRQRILNAAMAEFSAKGYDHASTNAIVERAGIAKGLLFHYFKSKKQLFFYLYDYAVQRVLQEVYASPAMQERDFFEKMHVGQLAKMALLRRHPEMFRFMQAAYLEESPAVKDELERLNQSLIQTITATFLADLDRSRFKDGLDVQMAINTVLWSLEGYTNRYLTHLKRQQADFDHDAAMREAEKYLRFFRDCFYQ